MEVVYILVGLIVGYIIGVLRLTSGGTLKIDHSDPEKDRYRFEIDDLASLDKKKKIILKIDHNANLSQE